MNDETIYQLLLDCGFGDSTWSSPAPHGYRWSVVGELEGGFQIAVQCVSGPRGGYVLLVPSESARQLVLDMLAQNGVGRVDVRAEQIEPRAHGPWLALTLGAGALALFGWVITSIRPFLP